MTDGVIYDTDNDIVRLATVGEGDDGKLKDLEVQKRADAVLQKLESGLTYKLGDNPPWYSTIIIAFQHLLTMFGGCITLPLIMAPHLCIAGDIAHISRLISTIFFVCGIQSFVQTTFGVRLPIVQGPSFAFILPLVTVMSQKGECPIATDEANSTASTNTHSDAVDEEFRTRMQEVQGALLVSAGFEMIIGFGGVVTFLLRYIGPLTIAPTVGLIGLSLTSIATEKCGKHWGIAALTIILIILFSQYIERFSIPCPGFNRKDSCYMTKVPVFRLFPVFLSVMISWFFCAILTLTDVFPDDPTHPAYQVRTDANKAGISDAPWIRVPYPGQWGLPTASPGLVLGMIASTLASIVDSIGDYYACARLSGAPAPPAHAVNRGIGLEGIGYTLAGLFGTGVNSGSYSSNIGIIGLTKVSSRLVIQVLSAYLLLLGIFLKLGAVLATIPEPIIGGIVATAAGMVTSVGISNLQFVDMNSPRNLFIVGFSFFMGLALPQYLNEHRGAINTGVDSIDQIFTVVLGTNMFIGGLTGFILDNTIAGTPEQRGLRKMLEVASTPDDETEQDEDLQKEVLSLVNRSYDLPFGMSYIRDRKWTSRLPFSPTFTGFNIGCRFKARFWKREQQNKVDNV